MLYMYISHRSPSREACLPVETRAIGGNFEEFLGNLATSPAAFLFFYMS